MRVTLPKLPAITEFRTAGQRARNWVPIEAKLRAIVARDLAKKPTTKTPTSTGALDRSLKGLDVWRPERLSIEWGSDLEYARPHDAWRRKNGKTPILDYSRQLDRDVMQALADWIVSGRRS